MALDIVTVPCLNDNYAFLAHDVATGATAVVDVPEAAPILNALRERGWRASHILITHHHDDHIDGVKALAAATGARVIGAAADAHRLPPLDEAVTEGDIVRIGMDEGRVIDVSGPYGRTCRLSFPGFEGCLHRRQPDGARLRPGVRGDAAADVAQPVEAGQPAARHAGLFGPRIHRSERALRADH